MIAKRLVLVGALLGGLLAFQAPAGALTITTNPDNDGVSDVNTVNNSRTDEAITQVLITGPSGGLFVYPDFASSPPLADESQAIADGLAFLGLPGSTPILSTSLSIIGTANHVETSTTVNIAPGATFQLPVGSDFYQGDDAIALLTDANVLDLFIFQCCVDITIVNTDVTEISYLLTVNPEAADSAAAAPLPATLPLFATGLGAASLLGWRRRRKAVARAARSKHPI